MHWLQRKKPQLSTKSHFWKNGILLRFFSFFQKWDFNSVDIILHTEMHTAFLTVLHNTAPSTVLKPLFSKHRPSVPMLSIHWNVCLQRSRDALSPVSGIFYLSNKAMELVSAHPMYLINLYGVGLLITDPPPTCFTTLSSLPDPRGAGLHLAF